MIETAVKELMKEYRKCVRQQKQKEYENRTSQTAKENFQRPPYMGIYGGQK